MLVAVVVFGAATVVFGLSTSYLLSLAMLALLGAADMFSVYIRQSLIQLHTPDEMRGRVAAASTLAISASNELGEARSGFTAALIGPIAATVAGGIAAIGITLIWAWWFPELRRARTFELADDPPPQTPLPSRRRLTAVNNAACPRCNVSARRRLPHESNSILDTIGNPPWSASIACSAMPPTCGSIRALESRRVDQGSHRAGDDRGCRKIGYASLAG